jgi:tRNA-uridine 2-sulfurtransferase
MGKKQVLLGMSGGVDSSVAAALLIEQGYEVYGVTLKLWQHEGEEEGPWQSRTCCKIGIARHVAKQLGIPYEVVDLQAGFRATVVEDFIHGYLHGETPNPCVRCNEQIKFGAFLALATERRMDYLATGHYARVLYDPLRERHVLQRAVDENKDQSYFLYRLRQDQLARVLFPLGEMRKSEVWERAEALGLPPEVLTESQEICFVTQRDYRDFLQAEAPEAVRAGQGEMVTTQGRGLGPHPGIAFFTIGQRRGLGVSAGERQYVVRLDATRNQVIIGREEDLYRGRLCADRLNWVAIAGLSAPLRSTVKVRYRGPFVPAELIPAGPDHICVEFDQPQRAVTPGQSVVFYQGETVLGGGIISASGSGDNP